MTFGLPPTFRKNLRRYIARDYFALDGLIVTGRTLTPAPGTCTIVDTENKLSIANGKLVIAGGKAAPAYGDPGYWMGTPITRKAGQIVAFKVNLNDATKNIEVGLDTGKSGELAGHRLRIAADVLKCYDGATTGPTVFVPLDATDYVLVIITRAAGAQFFVKTSTGYYKRLRPADTDTTATFYAGISNYDAAGTVSPIIVSRKLWLPTPILSDSFAAADATSNDNRLSDGLGHAETTGLGSGGVLAWSGASGAIASNRLVITPTLGNELLSDGGFENWTSDTDLTNWTESKFGTSTINKESSVINSGSYALRCDIDASNSAAYAYQLSIPVGNWYRVSFYAKSSVAGKTIYVDIGGNIGPATLTDLYVQYVKTGKSAAAGTFALIRSGAASSSLYFDDVSVKQITLSSTLNLNKDPLSTSDIHIKTQIIRTAGLQAGIVLGVNSRTAPTSGIWVYLDGAGNVKIEINESGTWTTKATVAVTYVADAYIEAFLDGVTLKVYYNSLLVGSFITLSAGEKANLSGLYAGLFSTSELNSFKNTVVFSIGNSDEYEILTRILGV